MGVRRKRGGASLPVLTALVALGALGGLAVMTASAGASNDGAEHASAELRTAPSATYPDGEVVGFAKFTEDGTGVVHVNVHVKGLTVGLHGIHVHNTASCSGVGFTGAGTHHTPGAHPAHAGDLPNLTVNKAGVGRLNTTTQRLTLSPGPTTVFDINGSTDGSAVVIHAAHDDLSTAPTGNSGARLVCGTIEAG